jgi:hypothetical protein
MPFQYDFDKKMYKYCDSEKERIYVKSHLENEDLSLTPNEVLKFMIYELSKENQELKNEVDDLNIRDTILKVTMSESRCCDLCDTYYFHNLDGKEFECELCDDIHCGYCTDAISIGDCEYGSKCFYDSNLNKCSVCNVDMKDLNLENIYICGKCDQLHCKTCIENVHIFAYGNKYSHGETVGINCFNKKIECSCCNLAKPVYQVYCKTCESFYCLDDDPSCECYETFKH